MQDKIFSFLILIIFSEQHDRNATQSGTEPRGLPRGHAGMGEGWLPRGNTLRLITLVAFQGLKKKANLNFPLWHRMA